VQLHYTLCGDLPTELNWQPIGLRHGSRHWTVRTLQTSLHYVTSVLQPLKFSLKLWSLDVMDGCGPQYVPMVALLLAAAKAVAIALASCVACRSSLHIFSTLACATMQLWLIPEQKLNGLHRLTLHRFAQRNSIACLQRPAEGKG